MKTKSSPELPSNGVSYTDVLARLATASMRLSDILRPLGIGVVVFCWGLLTADKGLARDVAVAHRHWIAVTAAIAILGLSFDLFQAIVGYWVPSRLLQNMEENNLATSFYDYTSLVYRSSTFFFVGKAILMPVAAASIAILIFFMAV
jgi:hypothetical protein